MSKTIHLVNSARLEMSEVRSLGAAGGNFVDFVDVSLQYDSPLPENATEDRSKVTCRSCLHLMHFPSPYARTELRRKVSNTPDFGETWEERRGDCCGGSPVLRKCKSSKVVRDSRAEPYHCPCVRKDKVVRPRFVSEQVMGVDCPLVQVVGSWMSRSAERFPLLET